MFDGHLSEFAGLPVVEFPCHGSEEERLGSVRKRGGDVRNPGAAAWRLRLSHPWDEVSFPAYLSAFLSAVPSEDVSALVLGCWSECVYQSGPRAALETLAAHVGELPNLRSLFVGDVVFQESELSWIQQADMAPLLEAFPRLEELAVRGTGYSMGGDRLGLHVPEHTSLRSLTVQSGGLSTDTVRDVVTSGLPALERLELWMGTEEYGGDAFPEDLAPVLSGEAFPRLAHLGLRNAEVADAWALALAEAPVTARLRTLDLSLGILTDRGAQAFLDRTDAFAHLERLDLHHHYLSDETAERVRAAFAGTGTEVDLSDPQEPEDDGVECYYYTAAGE